MTAATPDPQADLVAAVAEALSVEISVTENGKTQTMRREIGRKAARSRTTKGKSDAQP